MIPRAKRLQSIGFTSLLVDLQAHGETPGKMITFGFLESTGAAQALAYLRDQLSCRKIVAIGQSLGGASLLLGNQQIQADALVLESVYPSIEKAVENRLALRFGAIGTLAAPLLYRQIPWRAGITLDDLRPVDAARRLRIPVLIAGGSEDTRTTVADSKLIYDAIPVGSKHFWIVEGAAHQDLFLYNPENYQRRFEDFIDSAF